MRDIEIDGWTKLSALCEYFAIGNWIFRGVADGTHSLIPAIGRSGARRSFKGFELPYDEFAAGYLLDQFKLQARAMVSLNHDADNLVWLALGRHHSLPTPFLDWTTSLLVAAFFACQDGGIVGGTQCRAAIYAVPRPRLVQTHAEAITSTEPVAYCPPHVSPRIAAQSGLLTFHPIPNLAWQPDESIKLWLPSNVAIDIKVVLARTGINEASMMPDLDGLARYWGWLYKREFLQQVSLRTPSGESAATFKGSNAAGGGNYETRVVSSANATSHSEGDIRQDRPSDAVNVPPDG